MNYLDDIAQNFTTLKGMTYYTNEYEYNIFKKYFIGDTVLELGCADGAMTNLLIDDFKSVTVVDGSNIAIERLNTHIKSKKLNTMVSYFENLELDAKYDVIFMGHILEHVDDPIFILNKYKDYWYC
jgi:2-polyprenyl-3-methyl-5-hydroxy-6-metoxy-1,4-benzoquinol methylase